jgi:hypothetical protein
MPPGNDIPSHPGRLPNLPRALGGMRSGFGKLNQHLPGRENFGFDENPRRYGEPAVAGARAERVAGVGLRVVRRLRFGRKRRFYPLLRPPVIVPAARAGQAGKQQQVAGEQEAEQFHGAKLPRRGVQQGIKKRFFNSFGKSSGLPHFPLPDVRQTRTFPAKLQKTPY